jgi:hypothetical protein
VLVIDYYPYRHLFDEPHQHAFRIGKSFHLCFLFSEIPYEEEDHYLNDKRVPITMITEFLIIYF